MSLTVTLLAFDPLILPAIIHGLVTLILLRLFFVIIAQTSPIFSLIKNFYVKPDRHTVSVSDQSWTNLDQIDAEMEFRSSCLEKMQETVADAVEVESRERQSLRKDSPHGSSASVQAKMSLDLIMEQLKHEMSLNDIEDSESKNDKRIKVEEQRMDDENIIMGNSMELDNEANDKSKENIFEKTLEEDLEKASNGMSKCSIGTTDSNVKEIAINFEKFDIDKEMEELHQRATTIASREPVVRLHGKEEENLYDIIRSMVAAEVKRYRERERTIVRKVRSDTIDVLTRKANKRKLFLLNKYNGDYDYFK